MSRDIYNQLSAAQSIAPAAIKASANGTGVDLNGFQGAEVLIHAGAWTDGSHAFEVQHSDDNSSFAAVPDSALQGTEPTIDSGAGGGTVYEIGYFGTKRYLRVIVTVTGATTGAIYGAAIVRGAPMRASTR